MIVSEDTHLDTCAPPWTMFPEITPEDLSAHLRQGRAERWFDEVFRPFWTSLTAEQKASYLAHWHATPEWSLAMEILNVDPTFDAVEDARQSEEYFARLRQESVAAASKVALWKRMLGRGK